MSWKHLFEMCFKLLRKNNKLKINNFLTNIWYNNWRFNIWRCKRTPLIFWTMVPSRVVQEQPVLEFTPLAHRQIWLLCRTNLPIRGKFYNSPLNNSGTIQKIKKMPSVKTFIFQKLLTIKLIFLIWIIVWFSGGWSPETHVFVLSIGFR